mgnify:CR=1 FL=1
MYKELISQLEHHEGFRSHVYKDTVGINTIGFGTNLDKGITKREAGALLTATLEELQFELLASKRTRGIWETLSNRRRAVILNMLYNLGLTRLYGFKRMWAALEAGDYNRASKEMLASKWARQVGERAKDLARQMEGDLWQL